MLDNLHVYIADVLKEKIYYPSLALCAMMDEIFPDSEWWNFEYETILQELDRMGFPKPNVNILGQIQCLSALRAGKSFIDQEWHLFEKAAAALTGIPVLFYEKQNIPIENVIHAMYIMSKMMKVEYSEEVEHYIGSEAINDDIFWYPNPKIDKYIMSALERIKDVLGFDMNKVNGIRAGVAAKFEAYSDIDIDKAEFKENSVTEQMCKRIFASLAKGKELLEVEDAALNLFNGIRNNILYYTPGTKEIVSVPSSESDDIQTGLSDNIEMDDLNENYEIASFNDGVKEAMVKMAQEMSTFMSGFPAGFDPFNAFPTVKMSAIRTDPIMGGTVTVIEKSASIPGCPVQTGVYVGGIFPEEHSRFELENNDPREGSAAEVMKEVSSEELEDAPIVNTDNDINPFMN